MTNLTIRSDADQINLYLTGKSDALLSPALLEKLRKLERVADLLARDSSIRVVATKLTKLWPDECSQATAYRLIGEAQEVFSTEAMHDRAFYVDTLLAKVAQTRKMAEAAQDLKVLAACDKNMALIIEKFLGTNEAMPIDKIQPPAITFSFNPDLVGAPALPDNWEQQLANITKKRKQVGVVANHADFDDAQVLDETHAAGDAAAAAGDA